MIGCASSMQHVMKSLIEEYNKSHEPQCQLQIGSSGKLFAQIKEGSNVDIFIAADSVYAFGSAKKHDPELLCFGKLALWSKEVQTNSYLDDLAQIDVKIITIPNPKLAPFGKATLEALERSGHLNSVNHKFVYGQDVADVDNYIQLGATDLAFTSASSKNYIDKGTWIEIDSSLYDQIPLYMVQLSDNRASDEFIDFLRTNKVKTILNRNHYYSLKQ